MDSNAPATLAVATAQSAGSDGQEPMWKAAQDGQAVDPDHQDHANRIIPRD